MDRLQVKVISFKPNETLMSDVKTVFPHAPVEHQVAVDFRNVTTDTLVAAKIITHSAAHTIRSGRRWHHEMSSKGAAGLPHAVRLALMEDPTAPLLLLEDDCVLVDKKRLFDAVASVVRHERDVDVAVFGLLRKMQRGGEPVPFMETGWVHLKDKFWGMHCVLYTPSGRQKLAAILEEQALDMQIDSLIGSLAQTGELRVIGQHERRTARQGFALTSTVQNGNTVPIAIEWWQAVLCIAITLAVGVLLARGVLRKAGTRY